MAVPRMKILVSALIRGTTISFDSGAPLIQGKQVAMADYATLLRDDVALKCGSINRIFLQGIGPKLARSSCLYSCPHVPAIQPDFLGALAGI